MKQKKLTSMASLIAGATKASGGAYEHSAAIGITYATQATIDTDLDALILSQDNHSDAKIQLILCKDALRTETKSSRGFALAARNVLKVRLGNRYSQAWEGTGFVNSLEIPRSAD